MLLDRLDKERHSIQFVWAAPPRSWTVRETRSPLMIQKRARYPFDVVALNRCLRSSWVRLLVSRTRQRTFEMAPCDTLDSNSRHLPMIKSLTWERNNNCNNYRRDIGWHDYYFRFRWQFAYSDNSQLNLINANATRWLWGRWGNQHSRERADWDWTKWWSAMQLCERVTRGLLCIVSWLLLKLP